MGGAGPPGRRRVPEVAGRPGVLRLLRRKPVPHGHGHRARCARIDARPQWPGRRERALRGEGLRRTPLVHGDQRHVGVEPRHHVRLRRRQRNRLVRPQLPQVDRAGTVQYGRDSGFPHADAQSLRNHRADSPRTARAESDREMHRCQSARKGVRAQAGRLFGADQLHVRRHVLRRRRRGGAPRQERRPDTFRRGLVRLRAVQSPVSRSLRDAGRPGDAREGRPDGLRDAFDAQAAQRAVADVVHPHPRRPRRHRPRALQRGLLHAGEHVAALPADCVERRRRRDHGRPGGGGAHAGNHRRGRRMPPRGCARAPGVPGEEGLVLCAVERGAGARPEDRQARPVPRSSGRDARHGSELLDPASRRELAWLRRPAGRLVHARSDQVRDRVPRHEEGRPARHERHPGRHRHRLSGPPGHRAVAHHRSHGAVPVLNGRDQGQVGHAAQHAARLQGRLRPQRSARGGRARGVCEGARSLCRHGPEGPRRRDVGALAQEPAGTLAGAGLCDLADSPR